MRLCRYQCVPGMGIPAESRIITSDDVFDYLLDEPENSLSAEVRLKLKEFLEASVRAYNCQFIISTHSPFLLSMEGAVIYDLDQTPPRVTPWTEIKNVRIYREFFEAHRSSFGGKEKTE